jgi:RNA polymerase sigma-70 factor (ECF subfamily)
MSTKAQAADRQDLDVDALLHGDKHEFEKVVHRESPRLFRVIRRIVRDDDEAESVMQETYLQAYLRLGSFRRESTFTTWLYSIGINLARAALKKSNRFSTLEEADIDRLQPRFNRGMYIEGFESWNPQKIAEIQDRKRIIHRAIDQLPPDYRTIVVLRDIEELSTAEVAAMLNVSEGAARVRLHRARQALRQILDEHFR